MCRRQQVYGWILLAFGAGLLFGNLLESGFVQIGLGIGLVAAGVFLLGRK